MAKYLFIYYGGNTMTEPKEREKIMADWMKWFEGMGKAVVDAGAPTQPGKLVSSKGVNDVGGSPVAGYSIVQADNLDAAIKYAKAHPHMSMGLQVGVYPIMPM